MSRNRIVFFASCCAILFFGMAITTLGSVLPALRDRFHLSEVDAGALFSILPFGLLTGSLLFGPVSDRFGYKIPLSTALMCMFVGFEGIAFVDSLLLLKLFVFVFGMGGGAINGGTSALVSDISEKKGANLSILGVFFSLGALGMPFVLGLLERSFSYIQIISVVGILTFLLALALLRLQFPVPKTPAGIPVQKALQMLKSKQLLLIACFLFFQSALEGIINNWTPTLLMGRLQFSNQKALFSLSLAVVGMAIMRIALGTLFRNTASRNIWWMTFILLFGGYLLLFMARDFPVAAAALLLIGGGVAAGFPMMLGVVGQLFRELSGTAFSIVFTIALFGNMIINYALGFLVQAKGESQIIPAGMACAFLMALLCLMIMGRWRRFE